MYNKKPPFKITTTILDIIAQLMGQVNAVLNGKRVIAPPKDSNERLVQAGCPLRVVALLGLNRCVRNRTTVV